MSDKRYPVFWSLSDSPAVERHGNLIFKFSSYTGARRFRERVSAYVADVGYKLCIRFGVSIDISDALAVSLYQSIERRGFLVIDATTGKGYDSCQQIKFVSQATTKTYSEKPSGISTINLNE